MANDYRILDERAIKNFQAGNKLEVTEIGNKVTYEHIGEPPNMLPSLEKVLEYGESFNITVPSVYDSTGHVKSETKYTFIMPEETDISNFLTTDNFLSESPISVNKSGKKVTYSHNTSGINSTPTPTTITPENNTISLVALSAADDYGHATTNTKYQFTIPDTSNYLKKSDFSAGDSLDIAKGTDNNTVTYSHKGKTITKSTEDLKLNHKGIIEITASHGLDSTGHAGNETTYNITMPSISENYCHETITCKKGTSTYTSTLNFYDTTFIIISLQPKTLNDPEDTSYYVLPGFYTFFIPTYGREVFSELREYSVQYFYVATVNNSSTIGAKSCSITITPKGDPVSKNFTFSITLQKPELFETITIDAF